MRRTKVNKSDSDTAEVEGAAPESERTVPGFYVFDEYLGRFRLTRPRDLCGAEGASL